LLPAHQQVFQNEHFVVWARSFPLKEDNGGLFSTDGGVKQR
jgi:hypothetical protein